MNYLLNMPLIILYNKTKGAATIVATPMPISPRKNIKTIKPRQNATTFTPSSKFNGIIKIPIADTANSISHRLTRLHLSFQ